MLNIFLNDGGHNQKPYIIANAKNLYLAILRSLERHDDVIEQGIIFCQEHPFSADLYYQVGASHRKLKEYEVALEYQKKPYGSIINPILFYQLLV